MSGIGCTLILYTLITIIHNYYKSILYYFPGIVCTILQTFMILLVNYGTHFVHNVKNIRNLLPATNEIIKSYAFIG